MTKFQRFIFLKLSVIGAIAIFILLASPALAKSSSYSGDEGMQILYNFDDVSGGHVKNSAKNGGFAGVINGNVHSIKHGINGGALAGFDSTHEGNKNDPVSAVITNGLDWSRQSYTLELWVRWPQLNFKSSHWYQAHAAVIATGGTSKLAKNQSWELYITSDGKIHVGGVDWHGKSNSVSSSALTWNPTTWYHIAFVWDRKSNSDYTVKVYRAAAGEKQMKEVLDSKLLGAAPVNGGYKQLLIGAAPSPYSAYRNDLATGYFGGMIDEVVLWKGARTQKQLDHTLNMASLPNSTGKNNQFVKVHKRNPVSISTPFIRAIAKDAKHIEVYTNGSLGMHHIMTLTGYYVMGNPKVSTADGKVSIIHLPDGRPAIQVDYTKLNYKHGNSSEKKIHIRGRFIPDKRHIRVQFDVWGLPKGFKGGSSMIGRHIPGSSSRKVFKLGRWVHDDNGGVPYEVADGTLIRHQWDSLALWLGLDTSHPNWQSAWHQNCPLRQVKNGHWQAKCNIFITKANWRKQEVSSLWHKRPISLAVWTDKVYNWWTGNNKPLQVHAQVVNTSDKPRDIDLSFWARDYSGKIVSQGTMKFHLKPFQRAVPSIEIKAARPRDLLFLHVSAKTKGASTFTKTNLAILPPHKYKATEKDSMFGLSKAWPFPNNKAFFKLLQRMGVRWLRRGNAAILKRNNITAKVLAAHDIRANITGGFNRSHPVSPEKRAATIRKHLEASKELHSLYWEVGNEMNYGGSGRGSGSPKVAKRYVQYLKEIHRIEDKMNIHVKLMNGGIGGMDVKFVKNLAKNGMWKQIDAFCMHPGRGNFAVDYPVKKPWQQWTMGSHGSYWNFLGSVREAEKLLKKYGEKPLWLTEAYACTKPNSWWHDTLRHAAQNVVLTYAISAAEGVRCVQWYELNNGTWFANFAVHPNNPEFHYGLLNRDLSFKPSLMAYCTIAENLDQAQFIKWLHFKNPQNKGLLFRTPRGPLAILWNRADGYILSKKSKNYASPKPWIDTWKTKTPVNLPASGKQVTILNSIGQVTTVKSENGQAKIILDGAPRLIYGLAAKKLGISE